MKIYFPFVTTSHYKAILGICNYLAKKNYSIELINLQEIDGVSSFKLLNEFVTEKLATGDIVITAVGGRYLNYLIRRNRVNAFCIALFPGIVSHDNYQDLLAKSKTDILLLNSIKDLYFYNKLCQKLKLPLNGICFGASWFNDIYCFESVSSVKEKYYLFIEQISFPQMMIEKINLLKNLNLIAERKKIKCYIKIRANSLHNSELYQVAKRLHLQFIRFTIDDISSLIIFSEFILTISSSAAIEAVLLNKNVYILNDYKGKYYSKFFDGSGMLVDSNDLIKECEVEVVINNEWRKNNIKNPIESYDNLLSIIKHNSKYKLVKIKNEFGICTIFQLIFLTRQFSKTGFKRARHCIDLINY